MDNTVAATGQGAASGAAAGSSFGPYGALIGAGVGAVSSAFGSYLQSQQADRDYQRAMEAWQEEMARSRRAEEAARQQTLFNNGLSAGQYATGQAQDIENPYINYARSLGY